MNHGTILIVDDESAIRRALKTTLRELGFSTIEAARGEEAVALIRTSSFDAVLLDINMPGMSGVQACRSIRQISAQLPILMLTVRDSEDDKVEALDAGASDYVTKPFQLRELAARIRASMRMTDKTRDIKTEVIRVGDVVLDPGRRTVTKGTQLIHFTPKEFELIHMLMMNAGRPIQHARLLSTVWGPEYGGELEYLRTYMRQLRKKLEDDPANPAYLLTDSHVGYRFCEGESGKRQVHFPRGQG
jgi:two-component system, OmpR family, KDP operon response regulator KdpE